MKREYKIEDYIAYHKEVFLYEEGKGLETFKISSATYVKRIEYTEEGVESHIIAPFRYVLENANKTLELSHKELISRVYADMAEYETNTPIGQSIRYVWCSIPTIDGWYVEDGCLKYWADKEHIIEARYNRKKRFLERWDFTYDMEKPFIYQSKEEARLCNDTYVYDINGEKVIKEGVLKRLIPTDTQKEAIKALEEAVKRVKDCGLNLFLCGSNDRLYAVNNCNTNNGLLSNKEQECMILESGDDPSNYSDEEFTCVLNTSISNIGATEIMIPHLDETPSYWIRTPKKD